MVKKNKTIEKSFQFNCSTCQKLYQLIETHYLRNILRSGECFDNCQSQWKQILHEYYQEKVFAYLAQKEQEQEQEQGEEEEEEESEE